MSLSSVPLVREVAVQGNEPWPSSGHSLDAEPVGFADGQAVGGGQTHPGGPRFGAWGDPGSRGLRRRLCRPLAACSLLSAPLRFPGAQPPRWPGRSSAPGPDHISIRALPVLLGSRAGRGAGPKRGCYSPSLWALGEGVAPRGPLRKSEQSCLRSPGSRAGLLTICGEGHPRLVFVSGWKDIKHMPWLLTVRFGCQNHPGRGL